MPTEEMAGNDWSIPALKEHFDVLWETHQKAHEIAATTLEERLHALNELRDMVSDAQSKFLQRETYDQAHGELERRLRLVENRESISSGASEFSRWVVGLVALLTGSAVGGLVGHFLK